MSAGLRSLLDEEGADLVRERVEPVLVERFQVGRGVDRLENGHAALTLGACHEFRKLDAEAGSGATRPTQHRCQLRVRIPARGRDVEVGPRLSAGELAYEHAAEDGSRLAVLGVAQVRDLAAKEDPVVGIDRQAPYPVTCLAGGLV